ncbi:DNA-binding transcriptional regulator, MarR family [Bifidobacterium bohemicum]|uniref:Transcriptional regulator, MarR family n=1 Tax=Bifidobacterium bohemicum DSM 22767 TaxID=1437606 RepID=A0A086ZHE2_9BIFI|nr:MarR family transcriptional regulator [Bifidobacterium bohemicum]KFI45942.1 transcriptional regulator, MarR family [Bifidobacterium bohemicum DSM 22767]SCC14523.1 DNA-binding transcriptional regulator, MarR family [Bifidobacterium bohemicum]
MGFEQEAMQAMREEMHNGRSTMWRQVEGASKGEPFVLRQLLRHGTQTPSRLAQALHASSGRVSALLGALEKKGYVTRQINENDRRNILVSLTDAGAAQARHDRDDIDSAVRWIFSQMGERRTREYVGLTQEFMTYMSVCRPGEPRPDPKVIEQAFAERAVRAEAKESDASDGEVGRGSKPGGASW